MVPGVAGDLRQVGDTNHLMGLTKRGKLLAQDVAEPAADVGVNLIEQQSDPVVVTCQDRFQGKHGARQLSPRSNLS